MGRLTLVLCIMAFSAAPMLGQSSDSRFNLFLGYSYRGMDPPPFFFLDYGRSLPYERAHGWGLSVDYRIYKSLSVTADFAGQYGRRLNPIYFSGLPFDPERHNFATHQFLFGPRFSVRSGRVTEYAHTLFGTFLARGGMPQTNFAMAFGGGVDVDLNRRWAIRAIQVDYIPVNEGYRWARHVRIQTGIIFRFSNPFGGSSPH